MNGNDYLGPVQKGRVITILGDTSPCENAVKLAMNADLLVHEATFAAGNEEMAHDYFHSTTVQAAELAVEARHVTFALRISVPATEKNNGLNWLKKPEAIFPETRIAYDFFEMTIPKK